MSAAELKTLAQVIRAGWKGLANADQTEADQVVTVLKEVLEGLEEIEAAAEAE